MCELQLYYGVLNELLAECAATVGVLHRLPVEDAAEAGALNDYTKTLMVEIGHNNLETGVLLADEIFYRDLDILEGDVSCSRSVATLAVHLAGGDTWAAFNEEDRNTAHTRATSTDGYSEVFGPDTVCDPFLYEMSVQIYYVDHYGSLTLAIDNIVLPIRCLLSLASQVCNITTRTGLSDTQTDPLLATEDSWNNSVLKFLATKLHYRGKTNRVITNNVLYESTGTSTRKLISEKELVKVIPLFWRNRGNAVRCIFLRVFDVKQTIETLATGKIQVQRHQW